MATPAEPLEARLRAAGLGWYLALVLLIAVWLAFLFGRVDLVPALVVSAICAARL